MTLLSGLAVAIIIVIFAFGFVLGIAAEFWYSRREVKSRNAPPFVPKGLDVDKLSDRERRQLFG
jgi:hypothetical protein